MTKTMPRCETCKWWGSHPRYEDTPRYEGTIPSDWQTCLRTVREYYDDPLGEALMAAAGYEIDAVVTAPDFGCVQHELSIDTLRVSADAAMDVLERGEEAQ